MDAMGFQMVVLPYVFKFQFWNVLELCLAILGLLVFDPSKSNTYKKKQNVLLCFPENIKSLRSKSASKLLAFSLSRERKSHYVLDGTQESLSR